MAAPVAQLDDGWHDFSEFKSPSCADVSGFLQDFPELGHGLSGRIGGGGGGDISARSMEHLVSGFDDKLTACFRSVNTAAEHVAPVKAITEDSVLKNDEIWNALADKYGNIMPVDWKRSRTRSLHLPTLNIEDRPRQDGVNLDLSDDEELREQMDMHSIIVSCINEEPLLTAEQVIEEIEEMMQECPDMEADQKARQSDLSLLSVGLKGSSTRHSCEERLKALCMAELNELLEEVEIAIGRHSEELIQHLALRDELEFEKEVKNSFISVLIDVQNRQKEHRELLKKKKKKLKGGVAEPHDRSERPVVPGTRFSMEGISAAIQNGFRHTFGSGLGEKQYLTTVIPYEKKGGPPSNEDLQILTKILQAMRDDSDKVPSLLTDYILKALV
ncbi:fasciculation and elongation protein zeta-2 isoform X2 [Denticeps clupeoides]|uniref:Fasciculation and elongation protein zeta 2 n=1 Tax=Denticeps clupeoides TaxID=299321 RepID=A0AAY4AK19_9TELE|nr:fasciculation and elongation protein zeta-2 isoform X2 [Denticeps clupeoides]